MSECGECFRLKELLKNKENVLKARESKLRTTASLLGDAHAEIMILETRLDACEKFMGKKSYLEAQDKVKYKK